MNRLPNAVQRVVLVFIGMAMFLATLGLMKPLAAFAATSNQIPLHFIRSNDCNGELVELTGVIHLVSQVDPDGTLMGHFNYQDVAGTGLTSGLTYHAAAEDTFRLASPFPSDITSVRSFYLIGPGPGDNLLVQIVYQQVINANGDITVSINDVHTACR